MKRASIFAVVLCCSTVLSLSVGSFSAFAGNCIVRDKKPEPIDTEKLARSVIEKFNVPGFYRLLGEGIAFTNLLMNPDLFFKGDPRLENILEKSLNLSSEEVNHIVDLAKEKLSAKQLKELDALLDPKLSVRYHQVTATLVEVMTMSMFGLDKNLLKQYTDNFHKQHSQELQKAEQILAKNPDFIKPLLTKMKAAKGKLEKEVFKLVERFVLPTLLIEFSEAEIAEVVVYADVVMKNPAHQELMNVVEESFGAILEEDIDVAND